MEIPCLSGFNAFIIVILIYMLALSIIFILDSSYQRYYFEYVIRTIKYIVPVIVSFGLYSFLRTDCVYNSYGQFVNKSTIV